MNPMTATTTATLPKLLLPSQSAPVIPAMKKDVPINSQKNGMASNRKATVNLGFDICTSLITMAGCTVLKNITRPRPLITHQAENRLPQKKQIYSGVESHAATGDGGLLVTNEVDAAVTREPTTITHDVRLTK